MKDFNHNGIGPKDFKIAHAIKNYGISNGLSPEDIIQEMENGTLKDSVKEFRQEKIDARKAEIEAYLAQNQGNTPMYSKLQDIMATASSPEEARSLIQADPELAQFANSYPGVVIYAWNHKGSNETAT